MRTLTGGRTSRAAVRSGSRPGFQTLPAGLLLLPDEFFHKAAALLFAVEQAGGFHAFLPVEPDLIGPGDEPVEGVGRELFAVAGVWQAREGRAGCPAGAGCGSARREACRR